MKKFVTRRQQLGLQPNNPVEHSRGLGDTIEKFTKTTGIKSAVEKFKSAAGVKDCGCGKRRDSLNRMFPYNTKPNNNRAL